MLFILVALQIVLIVLTFALLFRKNQEKDTGFLAEEFRKNREELQSGLAEGRREAGLASDRQDSRISEKFSDFMKFLLNFQNDTARNSREAQEKLAVTLQSSGDRTDERLSKLSAGLEENLVRFQNSMREEYAKFRQEAQTARNAFQENIRNESERNRSAMDERLKTIQEESARKLDAMKQTVDEKLQTSLEKHFNDSFKLISERLEQVHKGLGEMQTLAAGVGDLKKVLSNVKTRGTLGEIQLSAILEQYLAPDQYAVNVVTVPGSTELVEFAVKMPGRKDDEPVLLPVDSKFPVEDFQRLQEGYETLPPKSPEIKKAQESFARAVKKCAADIREKYLYPPHTTPFGMMFVPSEGIYAEILRIPGLFESLQSDYKIAVVGPSNLVAFLNSLQLGFKTLAIEKRSNEVWKILSAVKTEFQKFGSEMDATRKSLQAVVNHVEKIGTRSHALERKLQNVQELSARESEAPELLNTPQEEDPGEIQNPDKR